jgi:hydroxyacylglutathione hydrolase
MLADGVRWFDDWFAIENVAPGVHAIGEPLYHWFNWSYLVEGRDRVLLFDTGPGLRNIAQVVAALTPEPLTVIPSHMHFDHTGNLHQFSEIAMADLPVLRACEREGVFHASDDLYIGFQENMVWKPVRVTAWWPVGYCIDLGGRQLEIIHTPGHSPDSISLLDTQANILFAADFIYPGDLYAQVPGSDLQEYLRSANLLLPLINDKTKIFCCHGKPDEAGNHRAPLMNRRDIVDLGTTLENLKNSGNSPDEIPVNARMTILADKAAYASWKAN